MPDAADRSTAPPVLILGASTRAAAHSAIRAGLNPICADLFADADLCHCARVLELADYPEGLIAAAAAAPECPWIYTGGLENHPRIVARVSESRALWGNHADALRRIRNPWHVERLLAAAGLPALGIWPRLAPPPPADGCYMLKPLRGAAGRGIRKWDRSISSHPPPNEPHYFQERRSGASYSGLFLALPRRVSLLAITRQLVGLEEVHAPPFAWCGTITPVSLPAEVIATIRQISECLGSAMGLRGLFGCDFLVDEGQVWLTEVNPRYPASTELVERVLHAPLFDWHRRACESFIDADRRFVMPPAGDQNLLPPEGRTTSTSILGKIVLYASRNMVAPDATRFVSSPSSWLAPAETRDESLPFMADIPHAGQPIARGHPVCTLFARAATESKCLARLLRRASRFEAHIK